MFERYSLAARRVMFSARYLASQAGGREIEAEHILLGLLRSDKGLARQFLGSPWDVEGVWREIEGRGLIHDRTTGSGDLRLSKTSKRVLAFAADEAKRLSNRNICTEHLLLGLLREEKCPAAEILREHGVSHRSALAELARTPHSDSAVEEFVRESSALPEAIVESKSRIRSIANRMKDAVAKRDFATARECSEEERHERDSLILLCRKYGLYDWIHE